MNQTLFYTLGGKYKQANHYLHFVHYNRTIKQASGLKPFNITLQKANVNNLKYTIISMFLIPKQKIRQINNKKFKKF